MNLTGKQVAEYFQRSFTAVDGLWFVKLEERTGFDVALEVDNEVWKVVPKIQARLLKSMLNAATGLSGLRECLAVKPPFDYFVDYPYRAGTCEGRAFVPQIGPQMLFPNCLSRLGSSWHWKSTSQPF